MSEKLSRDDFFKLAKQLENLESYAEIQDRILSYDLSDISFEDWKNVKLHFNNFVPVDFSKTHANIDFSIIRFSGKANFKGCNIKNLEQIKGNINPKYFDSNTIKKYDNIFLSDNIPLNIQDKIYNNSLKITDVCNLTKEQIKEISKKIDLLRPKTTNHITRNRIFSSYLYDAIGLEKLVEFYNTNALEYEAVFTILKNQEFTNFANRMIVEKLKDAKVNEIKNICFNIYKEYLIYDSNMELTYIDEFPKLFVEENKDLFLIGRNIREEVKNRYSSRELIIDDILQYYDELKDLKLDKFIKSECKFYGLELVYEFGEYQRLVKKYPLVFKWLSHNNEINILGAYLDYESHLPLEDNFLEAIKKYILKKKLFNSRYEIHPGGQIIYKNLSTWIESLEFNYLKELMFCSQLINYDSKTFIVDNLSQKNTLEILGVDNLKKLEHNTGIFSLNNYNLYDERNIFNIIVKYINLNRDNDFILEFKRGNLTYEEFEDKFVELLDFVRKDGKFKTSDFFVSMSDDFKSKHPKIFIDDSAPEDLKNAFYFGKITCEFLFNREECIPYLVDKNLLDINMLLIDYIEFSSSDFLSKYIEKYGNEKLLKLIVKYGKILDGLTIDCWFDIFNDEKLLEETIIKSIKDRIIRNNYLTSTLDYEYLKNVPDFYSKYPELFVDFHNIGIENELANKLEKDYYSGKFSYEYIRKYPQLIEILKNKNLEVPFDGRGIKYRNEKTGRLSDLLLMDVYGNKNFLKLCSLYGNYLNEIVLYSVKGNIQFKNNGFYHTYLNTYLNFDQIRKLIENTIAKRCKDGMMGYNDLDAPEFLKEQYPKLFLSEDAPETLKKFYYDTGANSLNFNLISKHKEWLPYLKDKSVSQAFMRFYSYKLGIKKYFEFFGEQRGLILGIKKADTVNRSIANNRVDKLIDWYIKTGEKFIPDYVIIDDFDIEEADKFLSNTTNWNKLMKLKEYSEEFESRDALLKLAYSFGVFDKDMRGFTKLYDILTKIPTIISKEECKNLDWLETEVEQSINYAFKYVHVEDEEVSNNNSKIDFIIIKHYKRLEEFIKTIKKDKLEIDISKPIISQIYKQNTDGSRMLIINQQKYPNVSKWFRNYLSCETSIKMLTKERIHQLFSGFKLEYNPEFREFLLNNLDEILSNNDYQTYITAIQKQFKDIKIANSNRKLTLDLAVSYVQNNKYTDVEIGNESVAEISAIAGYNQEDFNILQKIYNYGKQRIFSSIPRIENKTDKYNYEILRLDDPLAMAIGTLTDCCQELNNVAEVCMEHSMVDKNGRIFVVRDKEGNIVSQSWVWRNKDVICFDNIEIPNKAFDRSSNRKKFTKNIYDIYKKAAEELIEKDKEVYKKLLDEGKITEKQYQGITLKKVTVGIGYNDIAEAIEKYSIKDKDLITPLEFNEPVDLDRNLYTNDSKTQYILKEQEKEENDFIETYTPHNDLYDAYYDNNFTENELYKLSKLEINNCGYSNLIDILNYAKDNLVSEIANYYNSDKEKTKVIMNANFAIIYEEKENEIIIQDLFYNLKAGDIDIEKVVVMQIRLALEQIKGNKEINISNLEEEQKDIYNKVINLTNEDIDKEKGIKIK